jgi:kynurenine formamidase
MTYIYLSFFLDDRTPLYGGEIGIQINPDRSIENGDTANTKRLSLHNHSGTHIDYPNHFFSKGKQSQDFPADYWIFKKPYLVEIPAKENELLTMSKQALETLPLDIDFLILKTGFGKYREDNKYWSHNPGISPELATSLKDYLPNLRVVGIDTVSITSFQNREEGRKAHRIFLDEKRPVLLVEDMDLSSLKNSPDKIICCPLLVLGVDGAPVNVIAEFYE